VDPVAAASEGGDRAQPADGEQVDQDQPAGRPQHPGDLGQAGGLVGPVVEGDRGHHQVEAGSPERQPLGDRPGQPHPPVRPERGPADLEHGRRRVHAGQGHAGPEPVGEGPQQGAGATADVEHGRRVGERGQGHLGGAGHHQGVELGAPVPLLAAGPAVEAARVPVAVSSPGRPVAGHLRRPRPGR
jgi:hypothetical protein